MRSWLSLRTLSLTLAMCILLSAFPALATDGFIPASTTPQPYAAELAGHWAGNTMQRAVEKGIIKGYEDGTVRPNRHVTRAELAAMLSRLLGWHERAQNHFVDIDESRWDAEVILLAASAGVILGDTDGNARPSDNVTREEAVVMLSRACNVAAEPVVLDYPDAHNISPWAYDAVSALTAMGAVRGRLDGFKPREHLTRAEAVTMLMNVMFPPSPGGGRPDEVDDVDNAAGTPPEDNETADNEVPDISPEPPIELAQPEPEFITFGSDLIPILPDVPKSIRAIEHFGDDERGRRVYDDADTLAGIDVSAWQGDIDWQAVADDGIDFAIIRAGYRGYTVGAVMEDTHFRANIEGAKAVGLKVGVYFFSQAISVAEAVEEAEFMLELVRDYKLDFPIVFDWEFVSSKNARTNDIDNKTLTDCAIAFCDTISSAGATPVIYFYMTLAYKHLELERLTDYSWWLAQYQPAQTFYYNVDMWQYTSSGTVSGIEGNVDMNLSYIDYSIK